MAKRKARILGEQEAGTALLSGVEVQGGGESSNNNKSMTTNIMSSPTGSSPLGSPHSLNSTKLDHIGLNLRPNLMPPPISRSDRMFQPPPDPIPTPTIVCPGGFKNMKFVSNFKLTFTPPECCGGPREVEINSSDPEKLLCFGRIHSDTEVFLRKQNEEKEMEEICTFKYDLGTSEWAISFPELETVAYLVKPKPQSRVSSNQIYEIFSADGCSNYFNLGIEMEKIGSSRNPDFLFRILNSNLHPVATVNLSSNFKGASVTIDDSLWPSQKAVILATGLLVSWEIVQEIRRKAAWVQVLVVCGIIFAFLVAIIMAHFYFVRRDE